jgi:DNA-binding transcriptional LysR family regulator
MQRERITLHRLRLFSEVARRGNLRAASEDLRVSQPSISAQIRLLEKELGTKLWRKTGKGIELTPAGNHLLRYSLRIVRRVETAKVRLRREFRGLMSPSLLIGGSEIASTKFLPPLLGIFKKRHPELEIRLRTGSGAVLARLVLTGEIDLALVNGCPDYWHIVKEPFGLGPIIACVSRNHPLAKKTVLTQDDMDGFGFITRTDDDIDHSAKFLGMLKARGFRPWVAVECESSASKRAAALNGLGITLIFRDFVQDDLASGELVELEVSGGELYVNSSLIYHKTRPLPRAAEAFLALLREKRPAMGAGKPSAETRITAQTSPLLADLPAG